MDCKVGRDRLFHLMDNELAPAEAQELRAHLALCIQCSQEYKLLSLPRQIGKISPMVEP